jgi:hypothetical protein
MKTLTLILHSISKIKHAPENGTNMNFDTLKEPFENTIHAFCSSYKTNKKPYVSLLFTKNKTDTIIALIVLFVCFLKPILTNV